MRFQFNLVSIGLFLGILLFITGCNVQNPNVQDIIPAEVYSLHWFLSPSGDKLLYDSNTMATRKQAFVRFLATGQEVTITDCPLFRWLNDETVYCYENQSGHFIPSRIISNISADTSFSKNSIKSITADQVELDALLEQAKSIYKLQPLTEPDSLLVLNTDNANQYYHVTGIENLDEMLKNYNYTHIPLFYRGGEPFKKTYSPNEAYYSLLQSNLEIYDATNDQLLAEVKIPTNRETFIQIGGSYPNQSGGWAADSSGVYFQIYHTIDFGPRLQVWPIQKLCVPGAAGCSTGK